jgi:hypothetical protein
MMRYRSCKSRKTETKLSRSLGAASAAVGVAISGISTARPPSALAGIVIGAGGVFTQTHPGVLQSAGACFPGQHGCTGAAETNVEAQTLSGVQRRRTTVRTANPSFALPFMMPNVKLLCT